MWNHVSIVFRKFRCIPGAVTFQVGLIDHVNSKLITKLVDQRSIRIMTGSDGIDVILLHDGQILAELCFGYTSSCYGTEFMTVHTFKYNSFSI